MLKNALVNWGITEQPHQAFSIDAHNIVDAFDEEYGKMNFRLCVQ